MFSPLSILNKYGLEVAKQQVIEVINQDLEANGLGLAEAKVDHNKMITLEDIEKLCRDSSLGNPFNLNR